MRWTILMALLALAGCGSAGGDAENSGDLAGLAPMPERLLYQDIEDNELYGASCAFAPTGGGIGAIAIAMLDAGYFKLNGEIVKLAPLADDLQLSPPEIKYFANDYALSLMLDADSEREHGDGGREYDAKLLITATDGSRLFDAAGLAQCRAS